MRREAARWGNACGQLKAARIMYAGTGANDRRKPTQGKLTSWGGCSLPPLFRHSVNLGVAEITRPTPRNKEQPRGARATDKWKHCTCAWRELPNLGSVPGMQAAPDHEINIIQQTSKLKN